MKKMIVLALMAVATLSGMAQQSLEWGQRPLQSPEINSDRTVTFRLKAPEAQRVMLTGDFVAEQQGVAMTKGEDGVWQYTTP